MVILTSKGAPVHLLIVLYTGPDVPPIQVGQVRHLPGVALEALHTTPTPKMENKNQTKQNPVPHPSLQQSPVSSRSGSSNKSILLSL